MTDYNPMSKEFQEEAKKRGMSGYQYAQWLRENSNKVKAKTISPIPIISQEDVSSKRGIRNIIVKNNNKENRFDISDVAKDIIMLDIIDGFEFEKLCARIFTKLGYGYVENTQDTCDMGRDLLIHDNNSLTVVECKHWPDGTIGRPVIQKLHSATISSGGRKGILITTGKFSYEAIEHAKNLKPSIELIDRNILIDLAAKVGIKLVMKGKEYTIMVYNISNLKDIQHKIYRFIDSRFESYPGESSALLKIIDRTIITYPCYRIQYSINARFETSVGIIHTENMENGEIIIDGINGSILKKEIIGHFSSSPLSIFNKKDYEGSNMKIENFRIDGNTLKDLSKKYIADIHTKNVRYTGKTNRVYTKLCIPKDKDILISDIKQIYIPFQKIHLRALQKDYHMDIMENPADILCHTDMFVCNICNGYIKKDAIICNSCGVIAHKNTSFDAHSFKCKICGKIICRKCTYNLGFHNKICKSCASGTNAKPISMNMNQRNIFGIINIILGLLLITFGVGIIFMIYGIYMVTSNSKSEGPYYENIKNM